MAAPPPAAASWLDAYLPDDDEDGDFLPSPSSSALDEEEDFATDAVAVRPTLRSSKPPVAFALPDEGGLPEIEEEFDWDIKSEDEEDEANQLFQLFSSSAPQSSSSNSNHNENSNAWSETLMSQPALQRAWDFHVTEEEVNSDEDSTFVVDEEEEDDEEDEDDLVLSGASTRQRANEAEELELGAMSTRQLAGFVRATRLHVFQLIHLIGTSVSQGSFHQTARLSDMLSEIQRRASRSTTSEDPAMRVWSFLDPRRLRGFIEAVEGMTQSEPNEPHELAAARKGRFYPYSERVKLLVDSAIAEVFLPSPKPSESFGGTSKATHHPRVYSERSNKKAWTATERDLLISGIKAHNRDADAIARNYLPHREAKLVRRTINSKWSTERVVLRPVGELLGRPLFSQAFTRDEDERILKWAGEGRDLAELNKVVMPHRSLEALAARCEYLQRGA